MMELMNLLRRFGARKGVLGADKAVYGANKGVLAPIFTPNVTINCARDGCEMGARKGAAGADKAHFGANKVLAPEFSDSFL